MDTATPQDRYDAIQSRLTTIGGLAAELAAQASQALDAQAQVAESIESSYRQDLEQLPFAALPSMAVLFARHRNLGWFLDRTYPGVQA